MRIYLAGPLFTEAEKDYNRRLAQALEEHAQGEVVLPQESCKGLDVDTIWRQCLRDIQTSDIVVAVLDGADADSGTCVEIGYAYALGKEIYGIRTDFRTGEFQGLNAMIPPICTFLTNNQDALLRRIADAYLSS